MMRLVCGTGRLPKLYMWNIWLFMSVRDLEMVGDATKRIVKTFTKAPHWQKIQKHCNTAMEQNNIWSIAHVAHPEEV
jgi:hypothetical protein